MEISNATKSVPSNLTSKLSCKGLASIVILGVGLCAGLLIFFVVGLFALTQPVVDASEQFLALLGQEKFDEAYACAADGLRAEHDAASFARAARRLGLSNYSSASWHNRVITNQEGLAEGTLTTKSGDTRPVTVQLIKEGGKWRVLGVRCGGVEIAPLDQSRAAPSEVDLRKMATESLLDFNHAVQTEDFTTFYEKLSPLWQEQTDSRAAARGLSGVSRPPHRHRTH